MNRSRIYFDIDKTLVDTKKMLENIQQSVEPVGITKDVFISTVNQYLSTLQSKTFFDPEEVIMRLLAVSPVNEEELRRAVWKSENFSQAVFPEVISVLRQLQSIAELGTFSQGVKYWQERKLELSQLSPFFSEELRIIATDKLSEQSLARLQPNSWVIDDKEEVVTQLRQKRPDLSVLRINRTPNPTEEAGSIVSLQEILTLVEL